MTLTIDFSTKTFQVSEPVKLGDLTALLTEIGVNWQVLELDPASKLIYIPAQTPQE